jgi:hypothetical protein
MQGVAWKSVEDSVSQCKCAHLSSVEFSQERARGAHQRKSRRSLRVTKYYGGEDCIEEGTER